MSRWSGGMWDAIDAGIPASTANASNALVRDMIGTMVDDVLAETTRRVGKAASRRSARFAPRAGQLAGFSAAMRRRKRAKSFLYDRLYEAPELARSASRPNASLQISPPPIAPIQP